MESISLQQEVLESYCAQIQHLSVSTEAGAAADREMAALVNRACAYFEATEDSSPVCMIEELIAHLKLEHERVRDAQPHRRRALSVAVQAAREYLAGLGS